MKPLVIFITFLFFSFTSGGEISDLFEKQKNDSTLKERQIYFEIGLERPKCYVPAIFKKRNAYGKCPAYSVAIRGDGSITYIGKEHVSKIGKYIGTVDKEEIQNLLKYIKEIKFNTLKNNYSNGFTHQSNIYTYFKFDNKFKVIRNYGNSAPATIWALEKMIDNLVLTATWKNS